MPVQISVTSQIGVIRRDAIIRGVILLHTPLLKIRRPGGPHSITARNLERPIPALNTT
jgi:hypothetical protein